MKLISITLSIFSLILLSFAFGQNKEKSLYSFLQHLIREDLADGDSVIIDQISERTESDNWQAIMTIVGDSCLVKLLPPQVTQDTMVLPNERIVPINKYVVSKLDLLSLLENAKKELKVLRRYSGIPVEIFITQYGRSNNPLDFKVKHFKLPKPSGLYYIFLLKKMSG